jgi:uncharacterized metal-binding protein YceD (DUF177 family)
MHILDHFSLPFSGMKDGEHKYSFTAGAEFFREFAQSPIQDGHCSIELEADKRPGIMDLVFHITGRVPAICDRCLADIQLPVQGEFHLHVKTGVGESQDEEVLFIRDDQVSIDLSQLIYEYICLSLPLVNTYACAKDIPPPCNMDVLKKLEESEKTDSQAGGSNLWAGLHGLDLEE